jgi:hypothetical protein
MEAVCPVCLVGEKVNDPVEQHPVVAATNLHRTWRVGRIGKLSPHLGVASAGNWWRKSARADVDERQAGLGIAAFREGSR